MNGASFTGNGKNRYDVTSVFAVRISALGGEKLTFKHVSGLEEGLTLTEIDSGASSSGRTLVRNRPVPGKIHLSQGSGRISQALFDWVNDSLNIEKPLKRYDIEILVYSPDNLKRELRSFTLHNAYPYAWTGPLLSTEIDDHAIDTLSLAYTSISKKYDGEKNVKKKPIVVQYPVLKKRDADEKVEFQAQPRTLAIRQGASYGLLAGPNMEKPIVDYQHPKLRSLHTNIVVDWDLGGQELEEKSKVYAQVDAIQSFLKVDKDLKEPPVLSFVYGSRSFDGYLADLDIRVEQFSSDGTPLRISYDITLLESSESKNTEKQHAF